MFNKPFKENLIIDKKQLEKSRLESKKEKNIGPVMYYLEPYYMDSIHLLTDINIINDSIIITRCLYPNTDKEVTMNNRIEVWKKSKENNQFSLVKSLLDDPNYEFKFNKDSVFNKEVYSQWTGTTPYEFYQDKIYYFTWLISEYPIGANKVEYNLKKNIAKDKKMLVPSIVVYSLTNLY